MVDFIERVGPVEYNEANRYLPEGLTPRPGYIDYGLFPYLREPLQCADPQDPTREVNMLKGVQVGWTTLLESILFYYIGHIRTQSGLFLSAEKELAEKRVDQNIIPMLEYSDMSHLIQSRDDSNSRKTGKNKHGLTWAGGGGLGWEGAKNAVKMRMVSMPLLLKDELDGWPEVAGEDGSSDKLTDARASAYWQVRKIFRGSTPGSDPSLIWEAFKRGDQRVYLILCRSCSFPQRLKMTHMDRNRNRIGGFAWDLDDGSRLVLESVRYQCANCGHDHFEHDKDYIFASENGARWEPTAKPAEPGIRSYDLPAWYSPFRFRPWYKGVGDYLESFDVETDSVIDYPKYQEFYNNTLARPFKKPGTRIRLESVLGHRRMGYAFGEVPNTYAEKYSGSKILFLTLGVDVHAKNLAVSVLGWTVSMRCYVIDYWRFESKDENDLCSELTSTPWTRVRELLETKTYTADDGTEYIIAFTQVDAGWSNITATTFCSDYSSSVIATLGRDRPEKNARIREFDSFTTQAGEEGFKIVVDHYKDRTASVLRREWDEERGPQLPYHVNFPVNITRAQLKETTVEYLRERIDQKGYVVKYWHRPGNAPNELWDLLNAGQALVEIVAYKICIETFKLDRVNWAEFWEFAQDPQNDAAFGRSPARQKPHG